MTDRTAIHAVSAKGVLGFSSINCHFSEGLLFCSNKKEGSFLSSYPHRIGLQANGGGCFDNELDIGLQFINGEQAMALQRTPSFCKAWFSAKHSSGFRWIKNKTVDATKAQRVQGRDGTAVWKA